LPQDADPAGDGWSSSLPTNNHSKHNRDGCDGGLQIAADRERHRLPRLCIVAGEDHIPALRDLKRLLVGGGSQIMENELLPPKIYP